MMIIQTLEHTTTAELLEVFNLSFSDYIIPFHLTEEQLEEKMLSDGIRRELSVGAFEDNRLIGFILHGYDDTGNMKSAYNAGTGVIPAKRGNRLTAGMYAHALEILHAHHIDKVILEVITENDTAIKTYRSTGFKIVRTFNCFRGTVDPPDTKNDFQIRTLEEYDWQTLQAFWDTEPSRQNSISAAERMRYADISIGIYKEDTLTGYAIFNPGLRRIRQMAVDKDYRKEGAAQQLLAYISTHYGKEISAINIDSKAEGISAFLVRCGLKIFIRQYEMELALK